MWQPLESEFYGNRLVDRERIARHQTIEGQDTNAGLFGTPKSIPELRMGRVIWREISRALHGQNKDDIGIPTGRLGPDKPFDMFDAPDRGSVGKAGDALVLEQGYALDLDKDAISHLKIKAGIRPGIFRTNDLIRKEAGDVYKRQIF